MAIEWSGLSPELLIRIDRSAREPLRIQLETSLREAIRGGRLRAGERLPSSRELARELGISRGMVQECYGQLLAEGYLTSRTGSATRVADISGPQPAGQPAPVGQPAAAGQLAPVGQPAAAGQPAWAGQPAAAGQPVPAGQPAPAPAVITPPSRRPQEPPLIADFKPAVPDLSSFPRTDWAWAIKQACTEAAVADLGYGDPRGSSVLREVLAGYLRRVRAAAASPAQMTISTGFAQGINLVLRALARQGAVTRVGFEDPGYGSAQADETIRAVLGMGLEVRYVPVDEQGLVVSELDTSGAQAIVVTPAHQSPTGVVLSPARRHALTDWARRRGGYVIEDDYDSEFRYDSEPVGALQGLAPDRVFLLGTASKSLAPAVRLGWVHAPPALASAVAGEKEMSDRGSCTLDQLALATLLTTGRYDRHLRRMRTVYAARRTALTEAFARHAPRTRLTGLAAGFQAMAPLPPGADEAAVIAAARDRRVGLHGIADYCGTPEAAASPALIMGFGNVRERAI
ncbi:MAG TPA: PLP-dependent aminotransferase family protein, partial [Streptosporangiaceae bacterium]|nr:PLP-dependent aminotransferase family protein [Streptosporangiaceae bacterium]